MFYKLVKTQKLAYINSVLRDLGLLIEFDGLDWNDVVKRIAYDKKTLSGNISFILPVDIGKVTIYEITLNNSIVESLSD